MARQRPALLVAASLLATIAWHPLPVALANGGMPTPAPPGSTPRLIGPFLTTAGTAWPYDLHFAHVDLNGEFFQPGEKITITAEHISVPATTVTADANGQFNVFVDFTWQFCGPGATSNPAPIFHAAGNHGSSNTLTIPAPPCSPWGQERAGIRAPGAGTLHLILRYPCHGGQYWTAHASSVGRTVARWWIPCKVRRGIASLCVTFGPGQGSTSGSVTS